MVFEKKMELKDGRICTMRNARVGDAEKLIRYLKVTAGETPYLLREPGEILITPERERNFIRKMQEEERELMMIAEVDGEHIGNCSLDSYGSCGRCRHRCSVAIALYQKWCGMGLGKLMLQTVLEIAAQCGYEQAELEVVAENEQALCLYQSMGFEIYGRQPHSMKYKDGTYCDELLMVKIL